MRVLSSEEINSLAPLAAEIEEPPPIVEAAPVIEEPVAEAAPVIEEPVEDTPTALTEAELKATKNADLRDILSAMGFTSSTSGMRKADLVATILELQEA
jgi:hypothetical protein